MDPGATPLQPEQLLEHVEWVRRLARQLVGEAAAADDVAQQTLLTALERPPARGDHPRAWLATVARRITRRWRRAEESRVDHEARAPQSRGEAAAAEVVERANTQRAVVDSVLALDEPYRSTILMRWFEGLAADEVAARLEVPLETVRTRLKRGLAQLRGRLETKFGGEKAWLAALIDVARLAPPDGPAIAGSAKVATAARVAAPAAGGAIIVGTTVKFLIAAAVVVAAGFATWRVAASDRAARHDSSKLASTADRAAAATATPARSGAAESGAPAESATRAPIPSPSNDPVASGTPEPYSLHGTIRDERGAPVAGAAVFLADEAPNSFREILWNWSERLRDVRLDRNPAPPRFQTATKADGSYAFTLQIPRDGTWNIAAIHETAGFAMRHDIEIGASTADQAVDLELEPGLILSGTVTDEAGLPAAEASVHVVAVVGRDGSSGTVTQGVAWATTDHSGRFRTEPIPFRDLLVSAFKRGYFGSGARSLRLAPDAREQVIGLKIQSGRVVSGRLLDRGGSPAGLVSRRIPDLFILALRDAPKPENPRPTERAQHGRIDDHDGYEFDPIQRDARFIAVYCRDRWLGGAAIPADGSGPDVVVDTDRLPGDLHPPTGTFSIVAVDAETQKPIREYAVVISRPSYGTSLRGAKDDAGRFRSEEIPLGIYRVSVRVENARAIVTRNIEVMASVDAEATRFEIPRADCPISGVVLDDRGAPVPRTSVFLCDSHGEPVQSWAGDRVEADSRGRFEFPSLARGDYVVLAVLETYFGQPPTTLAPASAKVSLTGGEAKVELRLTPGITVKLLPTGRGVENLTFRYRIRDDRGAWVVDCYRGNGVMSMSGASPREFLVAPGHYVAEVEADHWKTGRSDFIATPDLVVPVEMLPDDR